MQASSFELHWSTPDTSSATGKLLDDSDGDLSSVSGESKDGFQGELPSGLPPCRDVDYTVNIFPDTKPPHRAPYQLSPAKLLAAWEYVDKLLRSGRIRLRRLLYGASLLILKDYGVGSVV